MHSTFSGWRHVVVTPVSLSRVPPPQQRTVRQSQDSEGALQDPQGAEDAPAVGKAKQGQAEHRQLAEIRAALRQTGER